MRVICVVIGAIVMVLIVLGVMFLIAFLRMMYYSIPYDEWVEMQEKEAEKAAAKAKKKAERKARKGKNVR